MSEQANEIWRRQELPQAVARLAQRTRDGDVRTLVASILHHGFGAAWTALDHEVRMPEVHGRADMLFGAVVFEFKTDLAAEWDDVAAKLPDYLADRERQTRRPFLGIATDGTRFVACELRNGQLVQISAHVTDPQRPEALLGWLSGALSTREEQQPEPRAVQDALGRESIAFAHARGVLEQLWDSLGGHPEVALKRQLWDNLLRLVYGSPVGDDRLFLQHTYLTVVAKTIAARVLHIATDDAAAILSGRALDQEGIHGAVESDFFDWVLHDPRGELLVRQIARQASRFRLRDAESDVLKGLYESLIDPAQRHDLGEYYTPDWLAAKLTRRAVGAPLTDRVLDPACGSGTFLFHAVRRLLAEAQSAGWTRRRAVEAAAAQVRGLDVHPVAVIIARVTWLLALGDAVQDRPPALHVPVFLGDAMQWNVTEISGMREVRIDVPEERRPLLIPAGIAEDPAIFDAALRMITEGLQDDEPADAVGRRLRAIAGVEPDAARVMTETYQRLRDLVAQGRNGIWNFVFRNLRRPPWLSRPDHRADVLLGNPPWVAYRHLSPGLKTLVREACQAMDLWVGGVLATQQDLSALFWARCAERYLKSGGTIAFVLPYAALNRPAFRGLRAGAYRSVDVRIVEAWSFDEQVQPLFPVPACVLIGRRERVGALPATVVRYSGDLPRRDATEAEADRHLRHRVAPWPPIPTLEAASPYRARFQQGATIVPRRFFIVEPEASSRLGANVTIPRMRGREGTLDKEPWKSVPAPSGPVEAEFVRPTVLGETIMPFRLIVPASAVIPMAGRHVLDAAEAASADHRHLAAWLRAAEMAWNVHAAKRADGSLRLTLKQRLDFMHGLSQQSATSCPKVVYAKAGTLMCAAVLSDPRVFVDHMAYWASTRSAAEADYLVAILNSEAVRWRIADLQPKGQGGARHFDNLMWELPIPEFDRRASLHRQIAAAAEEAARIAASVPLRDADYFTTKRRAIRTALAEAGISARIDGLVERLLDR